MLTIASRTGPGTARVRRQIDVAGSRHRTRTHTECRDRTTSTDPGSAPHRIDFLFVVKRQFRCVGRAGASPVGVAGGWSRVGFRVRVVTSPKRRCSGSSRPRRRQSRPGVSCPGPLVIGGGALGVGDEVTPDDVAEPALQRADRFAWGLAFGELAFVVAAAGAVRVADLGDRGDVQGVVEPPVAAP